MKAQRYQAPIGHVFEHDGLRLKVEEQTGCGGCHFLKLPDCALVGRPYCGAGRDDGLSVAFKIDFSPIHKVIPIQPETAMNETDTAQDLTSEPKPEPKAGPPKPKPTLLQLMSACDLAVDGRGMFVPSDAKRVKVMGIDCYVIITDRKMEAVIPVNTVGEELLGNQRSFFGYTRDGSLSKTVTMRFHKLVNLEM